MTVAIAGAASASSTDNPSRLDAYLAAHDFDRPTLVIDVDRVETQYRALKAGLGSADIHYAVKANPAREVIARLVKLGSHFDAASRGEIETCLGEGATPDQISFGNTIKRRQDIEWARDNGITLFAADAEEELEKIAEIAPGSDVYIRLIVEASEADWPLTRKFGCDGDTAIRLMGYAKSLGLSPVGMSFHVGSQTRRAEMWAPALDALAKVWHGAKAAGHDLTLLNIGGGFPIKHNLGFEYDYQFMINEIVGNIKVACKKAKVPMPNIYTEFGSFTVGESMAHIYSVIAEKVQNDRETWYMIDSSFITTLPDTWGIGEKFLMLPVNKWNSEYQRVVLGGITCDSHDYYDSEEHINEVFLPKTNDGGEPLYVGFFHTGAYQDQISGYGGIKHCLIPSPKHVIVGYDRNGKLHDWVYAKQQTAQSMLKILGYK